LRYCVLWVSLVLFGTVAPHADSSVVDRPVLVVGMHEAEIKNVERALPSTNRCPSVYEYPIADNQIVAEFLVLCQALRIGGLEPEFQFQTSPAYMRLLRDLKYGRFAILGFGVWQRDIDNDLLYSSIALLNAGEFSKGLYALPTNQKALAVTSVPALKNFTVVSNPSWSVDKEAIDCLGLGFISAPNHINMFRLVANKRADFLLKTFPNSDDLHQLQYGVDLVPLPQFKVVFNESLHFAINKKHPQGLVVFTALQKGLAVLQANGTLTYVYQQLGLINARTQHWNAIGCAPTP
jgi:hypothetical protein